MKIITRKEAQERGLKYYFTGKPCKRNHIDKRQVSNMCCCQCQRDRNNERRKKPEVREKINKQLRDRYQSDQEYREKRNRTNNELRKTPSYQKTIKTYKSKQKNKDRANQLKRDRYRNDPIYKIATLMRNRISTAIKRKGISIPIPKLNYTPEQLIKRMECQFKDGMSWDNHGEWHIDHKKPVARFIEQGVKDLSIANMLCNLQPLWASENQRKGDKF